MKKIDLPLLLSLSFPIFLVCIRNVLWTQCWPASELESWKYCQESTLLFLVWNLFLAFLPLVFAYLLSRSKKVYLWMAYFGLWMLFLPNAPYLISDLVHLRPRPSVPYVLDMILFFSFVWTGLYVGIRSLLLVQKSLSAYCSKQTTTVIIAVAIFLSGVGVYIGRYLRWNSWDIITQPHRILVDSLLVFTDIRSLCIALAYSGILGLAYFSFHHQNRETQA